MLVALESFRFSPRDGDTLQGSLAISEKKPEKLLQIPTKANSETAQHLIRNNEL